MSCSRNQVKRIAAICGFLAALTSLCSASDCCGTVSAAAITATDAVESQPTKAKAKVVDRVTDVGAGFLKLPFPGGGPKLLVVRASGELTAGVAKSARLSPIVYVRPPADGFQAFVLVADTDEDAEPSEVEASFVWADPPKWVRGVRIIADENSMQSLIATIPMLAVRASGESTAGDGIDFRVRLEETTNEYCVVGEMEVRVRGYKETWEIGRLCIAKNVACVEGSKNLGRYVKVKWKLCVEGNRVVLKAKGCERVFGNCTPWYATSLSID